MDAMIESYLSNKSEGIQKHLSAIIAIPNINSICETSLKYYQTAAEKYIEYYLKSISDKNYILMKQNFFFEFKTMYSLQGINKGYLAYLESEKINIIELFANKEYFNIYIKYFSNVTIKYGTTSQKKELGSFYSKLMSTLGPSHFAALDQPIKIYLGLKNESFLISYALINDSYLSFIQNNIHIFAAIRKRWKGIDTVSQLRINDISDLKLIDLIMWYKANKDD